jgi:hypothetical protein
MTLFTFSVPLMSGSTYHVTVDTMSLPDGLACSVAGNGTGTIGSMNVTNVAVTCGPSVGGRVYGLPLGASMSLLDTIGGTTMDPLQVVGNGASVASGQTFTFTSPVLSGQSYDVTVPGPPSGEQCSVFPNGGTGTGATAPITDLSVVCGYPLTVTVNLANGGTVACTDSSPTNSLFGDPSPLTFAVGTSSKSFTPPIPPGASYSVACSGSSVLCTTTGGLATATGTAMQGMNSVVFTCN